MKGNSMPLRVFLALLLALGGAMMASAQLPSTDNEQNNQPEEQKVMTDPGEYEAYMTALNTVDPAARYAALDSFLKQFPDSAMRDEALERVMDTLVQLDNQRTAPLRQQLRARQARAEAIARALAGRPDNLSRYTQCGFGEFSIEESSERDRPFIHTVSTAEGNREIEAFHGIILHVAYQGTPFANFKAERLGNGFYKDKQALIDSLQTLGAEPDTGAVRPWPLKMDGFEVYGINRKKLAGDVLSIYLLFHDADMTVVTLYLLNTPRETPKFHTLHEYRVLRDLFLKTYTTCTGPIIGAPR
jgi:hypothetical protein